MVSTWWKTAPIWKVYGRPSRDHCSESILLRLHLWFLKKHRMGSIGGHSPWLFTVFRLIPGSANLRKAGLGLADDYVKQRVQEGSTTKDLYYHLVRVPFPFVCCHWHAILHGVIDRRGRVGTWEAIYGNGSWWWLPRGDSRFRHDCDGIDRDVVLLFTQSGKVRPAEKWDQCILPWRGASGFYADGYHAIFEQLHVSR